MDLAALAFNWTLWAILVVNFGLAIYWRKPTFWRISVRQYRWLSASFLVLQCAQLVNIYNGELHWHVRWAPLLFISGAPFLLMAVITSVMELRQTNSTPSV